VSRCHTHRDFIADETSSNSRRHTSTHPRFVRIANRDITSIARAFARHMDRRNGSFCARKNNRAQAAPNARKQRRPQKKERFFLERCADTSRRTLDFQHTPSRFSEEKINPYPYY